MQTELVTISLENDYKRRDVQDVNTGMIPDQFHPKVLKTLAEILFPVLASLLNWALLKGVVLSDFSIAIICTTFKQGDRDDVRNYRPISLTSKICKVIKRVLKDKIMLRLDLICVIAKYQK